MHETLHTDVTSHIEYRDIRDLPRDAVLVLYGACLRSAAEKPDQLMAALAGSHTLISAWDGERLVGLGNAITDGALVVYYPHLLVHPDYQRRGIGREILRQLLARYEGFHQHALLADDDAVGFYRQCGFSQPAKVRTMWIYTATDHGPPDSLSFWHDLLNWSRLVPRQRWAIGFAVAQLAATIAAGLSLAEMELIFLTWPALAIIGLAVCLITWPLRSRAAFAFGLSAPLATAIFASLIVLMHWGRARVSRHDMAELLSGWIVTYGILLLPLFGAALHRVVNWRIVTLPPRKARWQFSVRSLLVLMTTVAVVAPILAAAGRKVNDQFVFWVFGGYAIVLFAACWFMIQQFVASRRRD